MADLAELDLLWNEYAVCPHCGYEDPESWEIEEGEHNCAQCDKPFFVEVHTKITYSTSKLETTDD